MRQIEPDKTVIQSEISEPIRDEVQATFKSNLAPMWLVFPCHIFNTQNINYMSKGTVDDPNTIKIGTRDGQTFIIKVTDVNATWESLQKVFADGAEG